MLCQSLKHGLCVIPTQAGIQCSSVDSRVRGNDESQNQVLKKHKTRYAGVSRCQFVVCWNW